MFVPPFFVFFEDDVKYFVWFNCAFVVNLCTILCFYVDVELFHCVHTATFMSGVSELGYCTTTITTQLNLKKYPFLHQ